MMSASMRVDYHISLTKLRTWNINMEKHVSAFKSISADVTSTICFSASTWCIGFIKIRMLCRVQSTSCCLTALFLPKVTENSAGPWCTRWKSDIAMKKVDVCLIFLGFTLLKPEFPSGLGVTLSKAQAGPGPSDEVTSNGWNWQSAKGKRLVNHGIFGGFNNLNHGSFGSTLFSDYHKLYSRLWK